jgi:hypothetical protein
MRLLLSAAVGVLCASVTFGQEDFKAKERREKAFAGLKKVGAVIVIDETKKDLPVVRVELRGPKVTDEEVALLRAFPYLESLSICQTRITDDGLRHLQYFKKLHTLMLTYNQIGDRGMPYLGELGKLEVLGLSYTKVGDKGALVIRNMASLQTLYLSHTKITDAGAVALKRLTNLKELYLNGTDITSKTVEAFKGTGLLTLSYVGTRAVVGEVDTYHKKTP